jgi:hypothetical protein
VRLALEGARPVDFFGRCGGNVPTSEEVLEYVLKLVQPPVKRSALEEVLIHA